MGSHIPCLKSRPSAVSRLRGLLLRLQCLKGRDKLVAVALLQTLHLRTMKCEIMQRTIGLRLGMSVRTVARALTALKAAGVLRWRRRGPYRSSSYRFDFRLVESRQEPPKDKSVGALVTAPDGVDRPYRQGGAPLCVRKAGPVPIEHQEPPRQGVAAALVAPFQMQLSPRVPADRRRLA